MQNRIDYYQQFGELVIGRHGPECICCAESFIRSARLQRKFVLSMLWPDYDSPEGTSPIPSNDCANVST